MTAVISMWFLIPLTAAIATAIAVRFDGRVRTGALIALGVAALQGVVTVSVSSAPETDAKILFVTSVLAAFAGFFHRELTGTAKGWVAKHAMWIWGVGIIAALAVFVPGLLQQVLLLAVMAYGFKIMIFGPGKKKDQKSSH